MQVHDWLRWFEETKTYDEAQQRCHEIGGALFHRINGTFDQLNFFSLKMEDAVHWFGICTDEHRSVWRNSLGEIIPDVLIRWGDTEPNDPIGSEICVVNAKFATWQDSALRDTQRSNEWNFVCDLIP